VPWTVKSVSFVLVGTTANGAEPLRCRTVPPAPTTQTSSPTPQTLKNPGISFSATRGRWSGSASFSNLFPW
jgi:hypothetical protein